MKTVKRTSYLGAKIAVLGILLGTQGGCGINTIKCYIETNEELLERILTETANGIPHQNEKIEK